VDTPVGLTRRDRLRGSKSFAPGARRCTRPRWRRLISTRRRLGDHFPKNRFAQMVALGRGSPANAPAVFLRARFSAGSRVANANIEEFRLTAARTENPKLLGCGLEKLLARSLIVLRPISRRAEFENTCSPHRQTRTRARRNVGQARPR